MRTAKGRTTRRPDQSGSINPGKPMSRHSEHADILRQRATPSKRTI
ncbi:MULTISPECIES: hypothetical protein [Paenibacillus]|uniref:Uncharacterized protein n=1 Tax=Paenibacillus lactis TaxID=228574 RepID=A0ABS4F6Y3_9BACL|nr:hypothetical protein [Paenibacillus lactis]MBP1892020.1 hypothetical protein [Paenibacillus lactis]